jgi:hypothetical protein
LIDEKGREINEIRPNMDIYPDLNACLTYMGIGPDKYTAKLGHRPKIERNLPREALLVLWKREMHETKEDSRSVIGTLYGAEEEYTLEDQCGVEAVPPLIEGQPVNFKLKPLTKENAQLDQKQPAEHALADQEQQVHY